MDGQLISGRYQLDTVLGRGGMATVWRGVDERLGRRVAVKLLDRATADSAMLQRFDREAPGLYDPDDRDHFVQLLAKLIELGVVAMDDESHARKVGDLGLADGERIDVEAARSEHAGDLSQHAGLILNER